MKQKSRKKTECSVAVTVSLIGLMSVMFLCFTLLKAQAAKQSMDADSRREQWGKMEEALDEGLPRTALEYLEPIIDAAVAAEADAEAVRALTQKVAIKGEIEGNKPEEKIVMLETEMEAMPERLQPMLQTVLAHWYWHYFQRNRWRFMNRTATEEAPGDDITAWDLPRIFAEIERRFSAALEYRESLRQIPIEKYDELLDQGTMPDSYRPTLYDFVAAEALEFYVSGEQAAAKPQDAFVLQADSPVFASLDQFLAWDITTPEPDSPIYKGVSLYQEVLQFHTEQDNIDAVYHWNLARLRFGYNHAAGEEKQARYKAALRRFIEEVRKSHELSAMARYQLASRLQQENELVEARKIAQQGYVTFPESAGGKKCYNLVQEIEEPAASINSERVWNQAGPEVIIEYKNLEEIHLRLIPWNWRDQLEDQPRYHPERIRRHRSEFLGPILAAEPLREWSQPLPATDDYRERKEEIRPPTDIEPGFYWLAAAPEADFTEAGNPVSMAPIWISELGLIMRREWNEQNLKGLTVNPVSGEPVANTEIHAWALAQPWNEIELEKLETGETDKDGLFSIPGITGRSHVLLAVSGENQLAAADVQRFSRGGSRDNDFRRTVFFTDRSIYRPGQTIRFKGICLDVKQSEDNYKVIPDRSLTVIFRDVNNEEIERLQVRTNDYGSFSGSFTAPRDRLTGRMSIRTSQVRGSTTVNVEEYKRPTFQVSLAAPEEAPRLNDRVQLSGKAAAYTGAPTDGAQVRWRVVREVRYPAWWRPPQPEDQEIAHGTTVTEVDGSFDIDFTARPAPDALEEGDPTFQYTVYADVTDAAGETRSAQQRINVGYTALRAQLSAVEWLEEDEEFTVSIRTSSLDGEGQAAEGTLKIYSLESPERVHRGALASRRPPFPGPRQVQPGSGDKEVIDYADYASWPLDKVLVEREFKTTPGGHAEQEFELEAGVYRAVLETRDRFGKEVRAEQPLRVLAPEEEDLTVKIPFLFAAPAWRVEPGETFNALWGSGYDRARAYVEIEHRGEIIQSYWTDPERTQVMIEQEVTEEMRGGFTVRVTMVRENRAYKESRRVEVPWSNKELEVSWERFVSKLEPGQEETWTAVIRGPDAETAAAEMVATLYDKSLDVFKNHSWPAGFNVFRRDHSRLSLNFENSMQSLDRVRGGWPRSRKSVSVSYRSFPRQIIHNLWGHRRAMAMRTQRAVRAAAPDEARMEVDAEMFEDAAEMRPRQSEPDEPEEKEEPVPDVELDHVEARRDLSETAFFFPHLTSSDDGEVRMRFTMPEALTGWRFMAFAHDRELRAGRLVDTAVTAKDLMVQPNPPRFLREGDVLEFTVRVTNQSASRQTGAVRLNFSDARSGDSFDEALKNNTPEKRFEVPAGQSRAYSWRLEVPEDPRILIYRAVASTGRLSDGEEGYLPILSRRILVTESLPLDIRGPGKRRFEFDKLLNAGASPTLESKTLTLQMTSNPAWYAVMALPYLMEFPHQCSEQVFNRLYANQLAAHIANADPKIRRVFDQWKGTDALDSPLEKNEEIKDIALMETPWVRQAESESQARRNIGILFDQNRLAEESRRTLHQLTQMQLADGSWPWFPGGRPNDFITLYITTGFGRLRHLGVDVDIAPALKALNRLDNWMEERYQGILTSPDPERYVPSSRIAFYLYGRTFFLEDRPVADEHREALDFFIDRARENWLRVSSRQSQGHLALALHRFGEREAARRIMRSIKERSVTDEELGRFWRDMERSWWWYRAPIETQALMIEAFDEVMDDAEAVDECQVWLLKQKQTQNWKTTKATADAVYALLLRGADRLASDEIVTVSLGDEMIEPEETEAGTGFYEKRFVGEEIKPEMGEVTVEKVDEGVAWGGLHWQYLEDIANITSHEETPLTLEKAVYTKEHTADGLQLKAVDGPVRVGDELVSRIVLRTDRDMEYVHLKDSRGSGTEPVNVISRYRFQDGLRYYESTRDTASHFFIDYLPKGTYVFEYSVRVQHRGVYHTGMAEIQCMYAPEFNSHSESFELKVR